MTDFKVGDRITTPDGEGEVIDIQSGEGTDTAILVALPGETDWYFSEDELGLVTETAAQNFAKTAAKFANDPLSTEDIEALTTLGEQLGVSSFESNVRRILDGVADTVVQKNHAYGDSALNPVRIFSSASRMEQLFVRLDDKLSRVQRGHEYPGDDTIRDIIGYCTLILISRESE